MAAIYNNVRGLSGAILTGLGRVSSYLSTQLTDETDQLGFLSRRYPTADAVSVVQMREWALNAAASGEIMTALGSAVLAPLPADYPMSGGKYLYHVRADPLTSTGSVAGTPFYTIIISDSPLTTPEIQSRLHAAAQEAAAKTSGKSPGAKASLAVQDFQVNILSVWQE